MIIDEPDLSNSDRLYLAAQDLLRGRTVIVYVSDRNGWKAHSYRNWLGRILHERFGLSDDAAEIVSQGASFRTDDGDPVPTE